MTTRLILVTVFRWEKHVFGGEICSRHHFEARKLLFCRRDLFSSPFFGEKRSFLSTSPILVTIFE
ncbi:hypothetical protein [Caldifermentibacillus hisashii]|uniref:hypothetical protein n=1 Tax=Caldifermentibacillus hisashii TaxID=996558 RepID=UPI001C1139C2|nr:hypothetical protein [Caldifermentibacillus hisashii]MBU5343186.1 hypothetical protein [Caldifermentibacillus hisashii]